MWSPTVLLLLLFMIDRASGMCFEELQPLSSQSKRVVIAPSQTVASNEECKEKCWNLETCLAYAYRDTSCVFLGNIINKDLTCSVKDKNEIVDVKCDVTPSSISPSPTPIGPGAGMPEMTTSTRPSPTPMGPGSGMSKLPECLKRESPSDNPFFPISQCEAIPAQYGIVCNDDQCYCEDTNNQLVVLDASNNVVSAIAVLVCRKGPRWEVISPSTKAFVYASTVHVGSPSCTYIEPPTHEQCMCDMPSIYWGRRNGDNLCGAGKIDYWEDYDKKKHTTPLVCTAVGWTADGVPVKPDTVNCI